MTDCCSASHTFDDTVRLKIEEPISGEGRGVAPLNHVAQRRRQVPIAVQAMRSLLPAVGAGRRRSTPV
jgi:hypothetical protein